jgi:hypothetical protein
MSFEDIVRSHFLGSYEEDAFVKRSALTLLQDHGFTADNTLACVFHQSLLRHRGWPKLRRLTTRPVKDAG